MPMMSPTNWKNTKKKSKTKQFQKWQEVMMSELEFRNAWDQKRGFIQFNSLSFTGSFFLIFHFVFFIFLNAVVNRLSHFIQIWKNLPQLFSRRCEERRLILVVNLEGKNQNKNMLYCHLTKAA